MPLRNYKTSRALIIIALLGVFFFHGGIIYAITTLGEKAETEINIASEPATMMMHHINLAGVDTAAEITNQHDDEENHSKPEEEVKVEEKIEEPEKPEEKPEEIVEPEPEPVVEEPKEVIAIKQPSPEAPKVQEKKKEVKKPQPKPKPKKQEPKPEAKRQSKRIENRVFSMRDISILSRPAPNYPRSVMMRRAGGTTVLLIKINEKGHAVSVQIEKSSGNEQIDKAAVAAANKVRLKPYIVDGKAQSIVVRIPYQLKF